MNKQAGRAVGRTHQGRGGRGRRGRKGRPALKPLYIQPCTYEDMYSLGEAGYCCGQEMGKSGKTGHWQIAKAFTTFCSGGLCFFSLCSGIDRQSRSGYESDFAIVGPGPFVIEAVRLCVVPLRRRPLGKTPRVKSPKQVETGARSDRSRLLN